MRKIFWLPLLLSVMPLWAQKNLLPAVRASLVKPAAAQGLEHASVPAASLAGKAHNAWPALSGPTNPAAFKKNARVCSINNIVAEQIRERAEQRAINLSMTNMAVLNEIHQLWSGNKEFLQAELLGIFAEPIYEPSDFAVRNNQIVLSFGKQFFEKATWLSKRPHQGRDNLQAVPFSRGALDKLITQLSSKNLVFFGEIHYNLQTQWSISVLISSLRAQNPGRRIVLFSEFLDLPKKANRPGESLFSYYRMKKDIISDPLSPEDLWNNDYAVGLFSVLQEDKVEIYPLEDRELWKLIHEEEPPLDYAEVSALALSLRNKSWARTIEAKMAEIRKTDPDALFFVYAGMGHTSWIMPYALPKFFANENTAVVEIIPENSWGLNIPAAVWKGKKHLLNEPGLFYWKGPQAALMGKQTGFDYALVLPE